MRKHKRPLAVVYANGWVRLRQVQSTVYPTPDELGPITDFEAWRTYIKVKADPDHAGELIDDYIMMENLLFDARWIISGGGVK